MSAPTVPYLVDTAGWMCESCATGTDCPCWSWACCCPCQSEEIRHAGAESRHAAADMRTDGSDIAPTSRPGGCPRCGGPLAVTIGFDEDDPYTEPRRVLACEVCA